MTIRRGELTISKDDIDHGDQHPVLGRMTSILHDRDNIRPLLGHVDQITSRSVRELYGIHGSLGTNNVGYMGNRGTAANERINVVARSAFALSDVIVRDVRGSTQVQDLRTRLDVNIIQTTQNTGSQLASERVPHTELGLLVGTVCTSGERSA